MIYDVGSLFPGDQFWFGEECGRSEFVKLSYLNDPGNGLLVKDVCVVEVQLTVLGISKAL